MDENAEMKTYPDSLRQASEENLTRTSQFLRPVIVLASAVLLAVCTLTGIASAGLVFAGERVVSGAVGVAQAFSLTAVSQVHITLPRAGTKIYYKTEG